MPKQPGRRQSSEDLWTFVEDSQEVVRAHVTTDWVDLRNLLRVVDALKAERDNAKTAQVTGQEGLRELVKKWRDQAEIWGKTYLRGGMESARFMSRTYADRADELEAATARASVPETPAPQVTGQEGLSGESLKKLAYVKCGLNPAWMHGDLWDILAQAINEHLAAHPPTGRERGEG